jgi:prophage regulatory protein
MSLALIRLHQVEALTGLKRSTLYARIAAGTFPASVPLGPRVVAWVSSEIDAINSAIVNGAGDAALKGLVRALHFQRGYAPNPERVARHQAIAAKSQATKAMKRAAPQAGA